MQDSLLDNDSCFIFPVFFRYDLEGNIQPISSSITTIVYVKSPTPMTGYLGFSVTSPNVSLDCNVQVHTYILPVITTTYYIKPFVPEMLLTP